MRGARRLHPADTLAEDARLVTMATHQQQQFSLSSALNSSHSHHATVCLCLTDGRSLLFAASNHLESKCDYTISCYVYTMCIRYFISVISPLTLWRNTSDATNYDAVQNNVDCFRVGHTKTIMVMIGAIDTDDDNHVDENKADRHN